MRNFKIFTLGNDIKEVTSNKKYFDTERELQQLVEKNMFCFFAVDFVKSEWTITDGRMDSVGLDENNSPVIFEYKKYENDNIINQGLFYLNWLKDHKGDFKDIVRAKLGDERAENIDWTNPCVYCVAYDFNRYDEFAVKQMNANVQLIKYTKIGNLLVFDKVYCEPEFKTAIYSETDRSENTNDEKVIRQQVSARDSAYNDFDKTLQRLNGNPQLSDTYNQLCEYIESLGDLERIELKKYLVYRKISNIICITLSQTKIHVYLNVDINQSEIKELISKRNDVLRNMVGIGHYGTGNLELTLSNINEFTNNKDVIKLAYENN